MELQRIRNARGLKPSQLARLAGHHSVARLLSEAHVAPAQSGGHAFADTHRRSRRSGHARADQIQQQSSQPLQQQQHSRSGSGAPERPQVSQEAVIGAIVQVSWPKPLSFAPQLQFRAEVVPSPLCRNVKSLEGPKH